MFAGQVDQSMSAISIGPFAGQTNQHDHTVALGEKAGQKIKECMLLL